MDSSHFRKLVIIIILFSCCLLLSITFGSPRIFLTDEWISANQLNHLMEGKDLLYGYEPYGGSGYQESHKDILVYTLALPIVAIPEFLMFTALGDDFRLFINFLWLGLFFFILLMTHRFFPKYTIYNRIPWIFGVLGSLLVLFILNMWLYTPFSIDKYPEVAALVFTNNILFAGAMVLAFLIIQKIFENEWWALFGMVSIICGSSYLFWSEVGKDHILVLFFFLVSFYFFISWIHSDSLFHLISCYIGIGWVAWVRPDVGSGLFILTILAGIVLTFRKGIRNEVKVFFCSFATLFGAIPLFLNNYGLTGNIFTTPLAMEYQAVSESSVEVLNEMLVTNYYAGFPSILDLPGALYHVLFDPVYPYTSGFFQVSPISFLAVFCFSYLLYHISKKKQFFNSEYEKMVFLGIFIISLGLILPQVNNIIQLGESKGIVPDIRYLSTLYVPMVLFGLFFLKKLEFNEQDLKTTLESFFWIGIVTLPLSYISLQVFIGANQLIQVQVIGWINLFLLSVVVGSIVLAMAKKIGKEWLHYALPLVFIANCLWFLIVGCRFAYTLWEHYDFWLPMLNWI